MTLPWNTPVQGYFSPLTPNSFFGYSFSLSHILPCTEDYIFMNVYLQMDTIYNNLGFCFVVLTAPPCLALCLYIVIIHISPGLLSALSSALYHPPCSLFPNQIPTIPQPNREASLEISWECFRRCCPAVLELSQVLSTVFELPLYHFCESLSICRGQD